VGLGTPVELDALVVRVTTGAGGAGLFDDEQPASSNASATSAMRVVVRWRTAAAWHVRVGNVWLSGVFCG
jgi:hypothetical protein